MRTKILLIAATACLALLLLGTRDAHAGGAGSCGNGQCQNSESCESCPADCGVCAPYCGDGTCDTTDGETCGNCEPDCNACPDVCGDGACTGSETNVSCPGDCSVCGDGACNGTETCASCTGDCGPCGTCGDGTCDATDGETCDTCPGDCGGACSCGNGTCEGTEDCSSCAADCGSCTASEADFASCPADLVACDADNTTCCYKTFGASGTKNPLIIPMDRCHQMYTNAGDFGPPTGVPPPAWCAQPGGPSADDGVFHAYGLIYRLMQEGIPVYWLINPTKDPPRLTATSSNDYIATDIDFWVLSHNGVPLVEGQSLTSVTITSGNYPIQRLDPATLAAAEPYGYREFPVRGSAFMIAAEDRDRFDAFWLKQGDFATTQYAQTKYDFSTVDLYEIRSGAGAWIAYQDYRDSARPVPHGNAAPVAVIVDYQPPRLARLGPAGVSENWLAKARLLDEASYPGCLTGEFNPPEAVFCDITEDDIQAGFLVQGEFTWAWIDNWKDNSPCGNASEIEQVNKAREFLTAVPGVRAGGHIMFMEGVIDVMEGCANRQLMGVQGPSKPITGLNPAVSEPFILRYPSNLFLQVGDFPPDFANGSPGKWEYMSPGDATTGYGRSSVVRLVTEDSGTLCSGHKSTATCDIYVADPTDGSASTADRVDLAAYARHEDVDENGVVFYMAGNNVNPQATSAHLRMLLNAFVAIPTATVPVATPTAVLTELSRSSPIIATVEDEDAVVQGTFDTYDPPPEVTTFPNDGDDFRFPYTTGHVRAVKLEALTSEETDFTDLDPDADIFFDAAEGIPPANPAGCSTNAFTDACRTVFTNGGTGGRSTINQIQFATTNTDALQALLSDDQVSLTEAQTQTLISRVLAGQGDDVASLAPALGGVDRSTVAVIQASPLSADGENRPLMTYFGGLDGMLHAICSEVLGPCTSLGQELWAFIPRTQLPLLRKNVQRFDGSPKVADVFGDFDGDGDSEWRTILTIQTGWGTAGKQSQAPAVLALDITVPDDPILLWEVATPGTREDMELGIGLTLSMGPVRDGTTVTNMTFAQTNNGGTGPSGAVITAIDTVTGAVAWQFNHDYLNARGDTNPPVPTTAIPGGATAIDMTQGGTITHVVAPDIYGSLWLVDAKTGAGAHGTDTDGFPIPVFRFTTDFKPIGASATIYRHPTTNKLHALVGSGGYADPVFTSWIDSNEQYVVGVSLEAPDVVPMTDDADDDFSGHRHLRIPLGFSTDADGNNIPNRVFSPATVAGGEVFIVTDSTDINLDTFGTPGGGGLLKRFSLTTDADGNAVQKGTDVVLAGGAASVDAKSGKVVSGSGQSASAQELSDFDATGDATELTFAVNKGRLLYLRTR